ncbi:MULTISPECIES: GNAT family N-acetyltransferase [Rhizobium]|uniref:GNAT family N-acetyltransferase n=1 Tax=Rhizobium TaxID=379 RepID=UPI00026ECBA6|nr:MULTISPECIES: GNAT family N-acetyltransferase [Rhizobium]EJK87296.1 acetyltransferase, ribosomal protein N-acetylase [Rhizobium sp. AP16]MDJ1632209.1 GNAT family N-acetyltransferase [Rhizobium rhizogenes]NTG73534.1 GNAT family N-acetyltransferase [Rhizobium rhizogenes]NTI41398.1 GNAT family N-acetyltransferase [Rhizobium rhizogenes]
MADIEISSTRTVARPFTPEDAIEVFSCISPEITRFMAWEPPASLAEFAKVWQTWLPLIKSQSDLHLVAREKRDGRCLGIVGLHALQSSTPELGIWLRYDVHGMGFGRELIDAVLIWASKTTAIDYFEYPVAEDNIASRCIAEAYGGRITERRTNPKYRSIVYRIPPICSQRI